MAPSYDREIGALSGRVIAPRQQQSTCQLLAPTNFAPSFAKTPLHQSFSPGFECISLAKLLGRTELYERLPILIQSTLRHSVFITVVVNLICIPLLWFVPSHEWAHSPVSSGFFLWFTADLVNFFLKLAYAVSPFLLILNGLSLLLTLIVLLLSWGFTKPVDQAVHWLAWSAAIPGGASTISTALWAIVLIMIAVITLVIWIVIICLAFTILGWILKALVEN